ncbi:MAG: type II toxin-antitoxin system RelE/ParE family toxin [Nitrospirota bacterium]
MKSLRRLLSGSKNKVDHEILVGNYRVIYRFNEEQSLIIIMAVAHGRQLLKLSHLK